MGSKSEPTTTNDKKIGRTKKVKFTMGEKLGQARNNFLVRTTCHEDKSHNF